MLEWCKWSRHGCSCAPDFAAHGQNKNVKLGTAEEENREGKWQAWLLLADSGRHGCSYQILQLFGCQVRKTRGIVLMCDKSLAQILHTGGSACCARSRLLSMGCTECEAAGQKGMPDPLLYKCQSKHSIHSTFI
mgnify:CR=1 FL=1